MEVHMTKIVDENSLKYKENGKKLMEVGFQMEGEFLIIRKTFVDDSLRGQKKGAFLMEEIKDYALEHHLKMKATCSFARAYFEKHPSDLYVDDPSLKEACML